MTYPIYIISLSTEIERRKYVAEQLAQYELEPIYVDAIDMRTASTEQVLAAQDHLVNKQTRVLTAGEVGCALSHLSAYKTIIQQGIDYALILEDDVMLLENPENLFSAIPRLYQHHPFDVLIAGYVKILPEQLKYHYQRRPLKNLARSGSYQTGYPWKQQHCGTVAYIITQLGAQKMLAANSPLRYVADAWDSFHHLYGIDIQHLRPCIALENNQFESTVGNTFRPINDKLLSRSFHLLKGRLRYIAMNYFDIYAKF